MAIALFATFVNQTPLFGNGAAGIVGGRKTLEERRKGENNRVMDGVVSDSNSTTRCARCLRLSLGHSPHSIPLSLPHQSLT